MRPQIRDCSAYQHAMVVTTLWPQTAMANRYNLSLDDFKVLENGRRNAWPLSFHQPATQVASRTISLPPDIVTNMPAYHGSSMNIILFDSANGDAVEHATHE